MNIPILWWRRSVVPLLLWRGSTVLVWWAISTTTPSTLVMTGTGKRVPRHSCLTKIVDFAGSSSGVDTLSIITDDMYKRDNRTDDNLGH